MHAMELLKASFLLTLTVLHLGGCLVSGSQLNVCSANITEANNGSVSLLYKRIAATDNSTCMHFVWSVRSNDSNGFPSFFAAQTDNTTDACTRECSSFVDKTNHTVNIPDAIDSYFSFGIVFTRLIEFLVPSGSALSIDGFNDSLSCECERFPSNDVCQNYSISYTDISLNDSNLEWSYHEGNQSFIAVLLDPKSGNETTTRFYIKTNFPTTSDPGQRLSYFPNTLFTANSSTIDVTIENFPYTLSNISDFESKHFSRLALEVFVVHGPNTKNGSIYSVKSLDDEFTPSVFTTITYQTQMSGDGDDVADETGFFQWKPISYQSSGRKSTESQQVNILYTANQSACNNGEIPYGLIRDLFGRNASNISRWFAVFGNSGDDSYFNSPYLTWTSIVGYGQVPTDSISMIVIVTIIVGLGIPAILVMLGAVYVVIKKKPWQNVQRMVAKATGTRGGYTKLN